MAWSEWKKMGGGNSLLLDFWIATGQNNTNAGVMFANSDYFETNSGGQSVTCKKACKGTAYFRIMRPAVTGTGGGNMTVNLLKNGTRIFAKTYTTVSAETIELECAVGDVLIMNGNTNNNAYGQGTVYMLFVAE